MLKKVLSEDLFVLLNKKTNFQTINEIRFRVNKNIIVISNGQVYYLNETGLTKQSIGALIATQQMLEDIVFKASEFSIYSINEQLKEGFIVLASGERIGICGSVIREGDNIKTISNFSSLNIRLPHIIKGCSLKVLNQLLYSEKDNSNVLKSVYNTLIISPPGRGKTTFLRDLVYQLAQIGLTKNVLVLDERGEIAGRNNIIDLGNFSDVLTFSTKKYGFLQGIRAMSPEIIVTDELGDSEDFEAVQYASNCGVKVIATIHSDNLSSLKEKTNFKVIQNVFSRYVVLKAFGQLGEIDGVYNNNFQKII